MSYTKELKEKLEDAGRRRRLVCAGILVAAAALSIVNVRGYVAEKARLDNQSWPIELFWELPKVQYDLQDEHFKAVRDERARDQAGAPPVPTE